MSGKLRSHLILVFTALIAGFQYSIAKNVMPDPINPSAVILIRGVAAATVFTLIHFLLVKEKIENRKDFVRLMLCALTGVTLNQLLFYEGLNLTTPINASLMMTSSPILVLIFSSILIKEKITYYKIIGIVLGATGAILLLINKETTESFFLGDILVMLNAASYSVFLVLVKPIMDKYHPLTIVKWMFVLGLIMVLPFSATSAFYIDWPSVNSTVWWSLVFIIVFPTIIAYYLNVAVLQYVNPSIAGIYIYLQPVLATIIAVVLGKDYFSWERGFYSLLIFSGVYLVSSKNLGKRN
ncbi:MAG TPA: DMT family transporter [Cytophagaceae bacterium]